MRYFSSLGTSQMDTTPEALIEAYVHGSTALQAHECAEIERSFDLLVTRRTAERDALDRSRWCVDFVSSLHNRTPPSELAVKKRAS